MDYEALQVSWTARGFLFGISNAMVSFGISKIPWDDVDKAISYLEWVVRPLNRLLATSFLIPLRCEQSREATTGFEPVNRGFADPRLNHLATSPWSGRGDSNPRPPPWQGGILPLNYFRFLSTLCLLTNPLAILVGKSAEEEI